ncbi:hypothetical protein Vretimale_2088 [Volvox reticuliferus]|uniref:Uncharacterized protein n=1 Tax=Volvox reticuliferus TaxID=1737510 RepID=A0A8J4C2T9_9CHLO|nr:hypothetical protein Vretifemale_4299 [Volvox reticuliferus]GIL96229.1 hypothetical protein Vretimale_2088 [Volvox reticuliferus]
MSSSLSQPPPSGGRPRTKGAIAPGSGNECTGLVRGALSGNIGASPFCVLATTPELPASIGTCVTASRAVPNTTRQGHAGLSLRRANSTSNSYLKRSVSGGLALGASPPHSIGRRIVLLRWAGAVLLVLQAVLVCMLLSRPSLFRSLSEMVKSASVTHMDPHGGQWPVETAEFDEISTIAIVSKLAAESRRSVQAGTAGTRRERMWPTSADLAIWRQKRDVQKQDGTARSNQRHQQVKESMSSSQPVHVTTSKSADGVANRADDVTTATDTGKPGNKSMGTEVAKAAAIGGGKAISGVSKLSITGVTATTGVGKKIPPFAKPATPFPGRVANPPTIVGVVFYGRRDRVRILDCYLQRNMASNGGLLTYVVFVTATWQPEDVEFLDRLIAMRGGEYRKLYPQRLDKGYTGHYAWMDPTTIYVKIDDDVVYISDDAIDHMLIAHNLNRYHLISANVVNHQPLELPHSQSGAHYMYEQTRPGDKTSWQPVMRPAAAAGISTGGVGSKADGAPVLEPVPFMDNGWDVWGDWRRVANVHYSFLANLAAGRLNVYNFPPNEQLWDFNKHVGYTRWRINMIMFKAANIDVHVYNMSSTVDTYPGDDEDYITRILPKQLNRTSAAVSQALAVHFSFFMQRAGLENNTDLLDRYTLLAEQTCGRLVPISP